MDDVRPMIPLPRISELTRPFWEACREGRLVLPFCRVCGKHFFRPELACTHCFATDWDYVPASGQGVLYSYSVIHRAPTRGFVTPLVLAIVDLDEGCAMFSNVIGCEPDDLRIGMRLSVVFEPVTNAVTLPKFRPAA